MQLRQRLLQLPGAILSNLCVVEIQGYELIEFTEMNEASIRDLRVLEPEHLQSVQAFEVNQSRVRNAVES